VPADTIEVFPGDRLRLDVVLTDRVSRVGGLVTDDDERPAPRALVVLLPTDRDRWGVARLVRTAFTDHDGLFAIDGLVEGDYQVIAVPWLPDLAWRDPDVLGALWSRTASVRMFAGEDQTLSLELSPVPPWLPER
jgi:hypothetical protein